MTKHTEWIRPEQRANRKPKERSIIKLVATGGSSGHVYVPPAWIGKYVRVTLMTPGQVAKHTAEAAQAVVEAVKGED